MHQITCHSHIRPYIFDCVEGLFLMSGEKTELVLKVKNSNLPNFHLLQILKSNHTPKSQFILLPSTVTSSIVLLLFKLAQAHATVLLRGR